eukprot:TRINITY_DN12831_c0_g6_i2.p1 TRINITY_DN12831_c0_g6~~TRINITY_DN12831_c0_g6_i2.p1  ORF type:complete len:266 (-),score=24.54 TRINITY_DN12831_c0_g6_i2:64-861(-)
MDPVKAQTNKSISKYAHAFPKEERFKWQAKPYCAKAYYDAPNLNRVLGPHFVSTTTTSRVAKSGSPSPIDYVLPSTLSKTGKTFGVDRNKFEKVFLKTGAVINKQSPGPAYDVSCPAGKFATKVTLKPRVNYVDSKMPRIVPGPGAYGFVPCINENGRFNLSTYRDSGAPRYGPPKNSSSLKSLVPGPGAYGYQATFAEMKGGMLSTYRSYRAPKLAPPDTNSAGRSLLDNTKPRTFALTLVGLGPAAYRLPSDFGYCDANGKWC